MSVGAAGLLCQVTGPIYRLLSCIDSDELRHAVSVWLVHSPDTFLAELAAFSPEDLEPLVALLRAEGQEEAKAGIGVCVAAAVFNYNSMHHKAFTESCQAIVNDLGEEESGVVILDAVKMRTELHDNVWANCDLAAQIFKGQISALEKVLEAYQLDASNQTASFSDFLIQVCPLPAAKADALLSQPIAAAAMA